MIPGPRNRIGNRRMPCFFFDVQQNKTGFDKAIQQCAQKLTILTRTAWMRLFRFSRKHPRFILIFKLDALLIGQHHFIRVSIP